MKASPRQQRLLLELQELDTQQVRLARRLAQLPQRMELEALGPRNTETRDQFMSAQRTLEDLQTEIGRLESEIVVVRQRHARTTERLAASTQAKEAASLQEELTVLEQRQRVLEDRELEVMESAEEAERAFETASDAVTRLNAETAELRNAIEEAEALAADELQTLLAERAGLAAEIQGPVLEVYEQTRDRYGVGAARLRGRVSEGSNMELDPADYQSAINTPDDELYFCPTSGAILVRGPDEDQVH